MCSTVWEIQVVNNKEGQYQVNDREKSITDTGVFDRAGRDTMSANGFYLLLGLSLCWGLGLTAFLADHFARMDIKANILAVLGFGLVVPMIGIFISVSSRNAFVSFVGYNLVVIPFGFLLGPVVNRYSPDLVRDAVMITFAVTAVMGIAGTIFPAVFERIGGALFVALTALLVVRILQIFIPSLDFGWIDYAAALVFSLYVGYDMHRAHEIGYTADNAVDVSVQLYLDIINLFLTILRILAKKK